MTINELKHPEYKDLQRFWTKWRLTYVGGDDFIEGYVKMFSQLEDYNDYADRKAITYIPAFAKAAVDEIKNSIFQRTEDITRAGGPENYQNAILGRDGGVDLDGSSMNAFIGRQLLPELLTMKKVGVYVDASDSATGISLFDARGQRPYIYMYKAEEIISWTTAPGDESTEFLSVLLEDNYDDVDPDTGLTTGIVTRYRLLNKVEGGVSVKFLDIDGERIDIDGELDPVAEYFLEIDRIPFVVFELNDSLLRNIANHQIALVNLASSDVNYTLKCNIPFYTEQYDPRAENVYQRPASAGQAKTSVDGNVINTAGTAANAVQARNMGIKIGATSGRRYPMAAERPGFISPPTENLEASIKKQEQLKHEIKQLVALAVSNLEPKSASAESKKMDMTGLEAGLSYIGLELENGERKIATIWSMYEGTDKVATIKYPERYSLQTDAERRKEAGELKKLAPTVPSIVFQKEINKEIARITIGHKVTDEVLITIYKQIDAAKVLNTDPDIIRNDVDSGLLDRETAAVARGYDKSVVAKAAVEHAERLARIAESQAKEKPAARGNPDADSNKDSSNVEKVNKPVRGNEQ